MPYRGATIPSDTDPTGAYRRVLCIPATPEWLAAVNGALYVLTQAWYWDAATGSVPDVTARAAQMYFEFQDQNGACNVSEIPVGTIFINAATSLPDGWLYCDGNEVLKADYPALWDKITNFWGTPLLGSDYFVLPDFRNRSPFGYQTGGGASKNFGSYHGAENVTLTTAQIPEHDHAIYSEQLYTQVAAGGAAGYGVGGAVSGTGRTGAAGSGNPHNNLHPVAVCNFIIFAGN